MLRPPELRDAAFVLDGVLQRRGRTRIAGNEREPQQCADCGAGPAARWRAGSIRAMETPDRRLLQLRDCLAHRRGQRHRRAQRR